MTNEQLTRRPCSVTDIKQVFPKRHTLGANWSEQKRTESLPLCTETTEKSERKTQCPVQEVHLFPSLCLAPFEKRMTSQKERQL